MTAAERLTLLKLDLQQTTQANDTYLAYLLTSAEAFVNREGVQDDGSVEYDAVLIHYAAYLFRKRAASTAGNKDSETAMPRFLRYEMNNLLFAQKAGETA